MGIFDWLFGKQRLSQKEIERIRNEIEKETPSKPKEEVKKPKKETPSKPNEEIDPNDALAYGSRGNSKLKLEDYSGAIDDYTKAIEIDPNSARAYNNRGFSKFKLEDYSGAIDDYTKAIEIDADFALAYKNRWVAYSNIKDGEARGMADWLKYNNLRTK